MSIERAAVDFITKGAVVIDLCAFLSCERRRTFKIRMTLRGVLANVFLSEFNAI